MALDCFGVPVPTYDACWRTLWPGGTIRYTFASDIDAATQQNLRTAMDAWQAVTGSRIRFIEDATGNERVITNKGDGCASSIPGLDSTPKNVYYASGCNFAHELGHVIGLSHEHQRYDRDRYIRFGFSVYENCGIYYDNGLRCAYASSGSDFGPYQFDSTEQYASTSDQPFYEKPSGAPAPGNTSPTRQDGSNVRQMYAYEYGWNKFFPLSRDAGGDKPLDVNIVPGVSIMGSPAVGSQGGPGVLDAYVRGSNAHIYHRFYIPVGWSDYYDLGGNFNVDPAAGSFGPGTAIVATGNAGQIYLKMYNNGTWSEWNNTAGTPGTGACAVAVATSGNTAYLVARSCDNQIYARQIGLATSSPWIELEAAPAGITWIGRPAVAA